MSRAVLVCFTCAYGCESVSSDSWFSQSGAGYHPVIPESDAVLFADGTPVVGIWVILDVGAWHYSVTPGDDAAAAANQSSDVLSASGEDIEASGNQWSESQTCLPECSGAECGSDGCGGNCGACAVKLTDCDCGNGFALCVEATGVCEPSGQCQKKAVVVVCDDGNPCTIELCAGGDGCLPPIEKADCCVTVADCEKYEPGFAGTCESGFCAPPQTCAGQCGFTISDVKQPCFCDEKCFIFGDCCEHICEPSECAGFFVKECAKSEDF